MIRILILVACVVVAYLAVTWRQSQPFAVYNTFTSFRDSSVSDVLVPPDGSVSAPSVTWGPTSLITPRAGVFIHDGMPVFQVKGKVVTKDEFRAVVTLDEWGKVQAWIADHAPGERIDDGGNGVYGIAPIARRFTLLVASVSLWAVLTLAALCCVVKDVYDGRIRVRRWLLLGGSGWLALCGGLVLWCLTLIPSTWGWWL